MVNLVRHSSSIGRAMFHIGFKVKYCHSIFRFSSVQRRCIEIFIEVAAAYRITITDMGFGRDKAHVHLIADIGLRSIPEVAKLFKGTSAKLLLREFPWLKKEYFWGSGLWSPVIYFDSIGQNYEEMAAYVNSQ